MKKLIALLATVLATSVITLITPGVVHASLPGGGGGGSGGDSCSVTTTLRNGLSSAPRWMGAETQIDCSDPGAHITASLNLVVKNITGWSIVNYKNQSGTWMLFVSFAHDCLFDPYNVLYQYNAYAQVNVDFSDGASKNYSSWATDPMGNGLAARCKTWTNF